MATKPRQSAAGGRGKTAPKAKGINVNLLAPPDNFYLCQKICVAKKFPTAKLSKIAKLGYISSPQLSVDGMIMLDYHLFEGKWRYVPEVSFDMRARPPKPILAKHQLFPPNYPYWGMPRKGTRRPDVIIIDGEDFVVGLAAAAVDDRLAEVRQNDCRPLTDARREAFQNVQRGQVLKI